MDLSEALQMILDALGDSVAELDEPLGVIREACVEKSTQGEEEWKKKYDELLKKYKERFVNFVKVDDEDAGKEDYIRSDEVLSFDDIQMFDGSTE